MKEHDKIYVFIWQYERRIKDNKIHKIKSTITWKWNPGASFDARQFNIADVRSIWQIITQHARYFHFNIIAHIQF